MTLQSPQFDTLPDSLSLDHATGAHERNPVAQFEIGSYKNFVYLAIDWEQKKAIIIDPQFDLTLILEPIQKYNLELCGILLTHSHFDHTAGVPEVLKLKPDCPIYVHKQDLHRLSDSIQNQARIQLLNDGQSIRVGSLTLEAIHTPGHSAGECCFLMKGDFSTPYLFTGDTLFIQDCGRTDFETGSNEQMFTSLQRLRKLPPQAIILPGHHYRTPCASTLAKELRESPPFQCKTIQELAALP
jgi:glyoxylase-like metal-dependent hydrolase (beta-lactamase superfamily II)